MIITWMASLGIAVRNNGRLFKRPNPCPIFLFLSIGVDIYSITYGCFAERWVHEPLETGQQRSGHVGVRELVDGLLVDLRIPDEQEHARR